MQQACAEGLIHHFDGVPPDCLEGFVTLRRKVIPGFRFVKCLRLLQAVPLGDGYTLGSRPLQCNNLSAASAQIATTRRLLRSLDKRDERGVGRSIEGLELADCVSFRFGLSVQPLDGCPERGAYDRRWSMTEVRLTQPALKVLRYLLQNLQQERSGADISEATKVGSGTLYPLLARLEASGWLNSEWEQVDPHEAGRPRRRFYRLTGVGQTRAMRALTELQLGSGELAWIS